MGQLNSKSNHYNLYLYYNLLYFNQAINIQIFSEKELDSKFDIKNEK